MKSSGPNWFISTSRFELNFRYFNTYFKILNSDSLIMYVLNIPPLRKDLSTIKVLILVCWAVRIALSTNYHTSLLKIMLIYERLFVYTPRKSQCYCYSQILYKRSSACADCWEGHMKFVL